MSRRERLRQRLLQGNPPTDAEFEDLRALYEEAGWALTRINGSHHQFTKPEKRTMVVKVKSGKVSIESLKSLAKALLEVEGG